MSKKQVRKRNSSSDHLFLKLLASHCRRIRNQKGYSIDRLSRETDTLSSSMIHRLENASGAITVMTLFRYAKALQLHPKTLLDFEIGEDVQFHQSIERIATSDSILKKIAYKTALPLYSLKAAAGYFGTGETVKTTAWLKAKFPFALDQKMFIVEAVGDSMAPTIQNGDLLVLRAEPVGTRQGKILLVQYRGPADPETGGSYTVKEYYSSKAYSAGGSWQHTQVTLKPINPDFEPIVLTPKDEGDFRIIAEYLYTLKG